MKNSDDRNGENARIAKALSVFLQLGLTMFCTVALAMLIGSMIDQKIGGGHKATIIFMFLGIMAALRNMFVIVKGINR